MTPETEPLEYRHAAPLLAAVLGAPPSRPTYARWAEDGRPTAGGRARLQATRVGTRWVTCRKWVDEFITAVKTGHLTADCSN